MTYGIADFLHEARNRTRKGRSSNVAKGQNASPFETSMGPPETRRRGTFLSRVPGLRGRLPWETGIVPTDEPQQPRAPFPGEITLSVDCQPSPDFLKYSADDVSELDLDNQCRQEGPFAIEDRNKKDDSTIGRASPDMIRAAIEMDNQYRFAARSSITPRGLYSGYPEWLICSRSFYLDGKWLRTKDQDENTNMIKIPLREPSNHRREKTWRLNLLTMDSGTKGSARPKNSIPEKEKTSAGRFSDIFRHVTIGRAMDSFIRKRGRSTSPEKDTVSTGPVKRLDKKKSRNRNDNNALDPRPPGLRDHVRTFSTESGALGLHRVVAHGNSKNPSVETIHGMDPNHQSGEFGNAGFDSASFQFGKHRLQRDSGEDVTVSIDLSI